MSDIKTAFTAFASFGSASQVTEMDNSHFSKMCKECKIVDKHFTTTDVDLLFNKIKAKGARKISLGQFRDGAIPEIAAKKKCSAEEIEAKILASSPASHSTKAEATKFHDDKNQYTGVHKAGGPTTIDRDSGNLSGIVDRRVSSDIRGTTSSQAQSHH